MSPRMESLDDDMVAILRAKSPAERLEIASNMWESARDMLRNLLHSEHPNWTAEEIQREVCRRMSHEAG